MGLVSQRLDRRLSNSYNVPRLQQLAWGALKSSMDELEATTTYSIPAAGIAYLKEFWKGANLGEKLKFLFELFDLDGDLQVEKSEMLDVFTAMFQYCEVDVAEHRQQIEN